MSKTLMTTSRSSPYDCSIHRVPLVLTVVELSPFGHRMTGITRVEFFKCPVDGCNYCKPNKWQKYPVAGRGKLPTANQHAKGDHLGRHY